ncbi:MAG: hypothetical protein P1U68_13100 [Verrucomicrobiales bacterium]|nr:hypothetical protein [Verrucomicrobiales bacterium]
MLRQTLRAELIADIGSFFVGILPPETLAEVLKDIRERTFPEIIMFWAWVPQLWECTGSCVTALTFVQNWYTSAYLKVPAFDTSTYCRARKLLPLRGLPGT